jgi:hypothetical protein
MHAGRVTNREIGIRLSAQFEIKSWPVTLQFGGAIVRRLNVSTLRVREKYGIGVSGTAPEKSFSRIVGSAALSFFGPWKI